MFASAVTDLPSTISQMECLPLDLPLTEPFAIAGGAPGVAHNVLVRVVLSDGTVGLGEAAPFTAVSGGRRPRPCSRCARRGLGSSVRMCAVCDD